MRSPTFSIYKPNSNSASIERFVKGEDSWVRYNMASDKNKPDRVNPMGLVSLTGLPHRVRSVLGPVVTAGLCWATSWAVCKKGEEERNLANWASTEILTHGQ
jgi:hypothetical protein